MACKPETLLCRFNFILLGKSGVGKSAAGNTILGREAFISKKSSRSTTQNIQMENVIIDDVSIDVYDTPGLFNTEMSNEDVMKKCQSLLPLDDSDPTVFLLVIPVSRFTPEDRSAAEESQKILRDTHWQNTWILFTRGDALESESLSVDEFIQQSNHLKQVVQRFDKRCHVFNNKIQDRSQVRTLLDKMRKQKKMAQTGKKKLPSWNFILLGKSGVGISAAANIILGQPRFISKSSFRSVTQKTQKENVRTHGVSIDVFDTPGLNNTEISNEDVIREYRSLLHLADSVPTVFLLVLRPEKPTQKDRNAVLEIVTLLGKQFVQNTWILFTRGDILEREGWSVEELIKQSNHLRQYVQRFDNRYHVFDNTIQNPEQVRTLLDKVETSLNIGGLEKRTWTVKTIPVPFNLILLGKSGVGISAAANIILGQPRFISKSSFRSVTQKTQKENVRTHGVSIDVFDTPGLYNTEISNEDVIREYRSLLHLADSVPTVFLLVLRPEKPTQEDRNAVLEIVALLGDRFMRNAWILFTRGDELERKNLTIGTLIEETKELKRVVQRFNNRYHIFNNTIQNPVQVRRLMEEIQMNI